MDDERLKDPDYYLGKDYFEEQLEHIRDIRFSERQARRHVFMTMNDWVERLDAFLQFNEEEILTHAGKITAVIAKTFSENEFEQFRDLEDKVYQSDFDRLLSESRKEGDGSLD